MKELHKICDKKEIQPDIITYQLNEEKALSWLQSFILFYFIFFPFARNNNTISIKEKWK